MTIIEYPREASDLSEMLSQNQNVRPFTNINLSELRESANGVPFPAEQILETEVNFNDFPNSFVSNTGMDMMHESSDQPILPDSDEASQDSIIYGPSSHLGTLNPQEHRIEDDSSDHHRSPSLSSTSFSDPENGMQNFIPFNFSSDPPSPVLVSESPPFLSESGRNSSPLNPFSARLLPDDPEEPNIRIFSSPRESDTNPFSTPPPQLPPQTFSAPAQNMRAETNPTISLFAQPHRPTPSFESVASMSFQLGKFKNGPSRTQMKNNESDLRKLKGILKSLRDVMAPEKYELLERFTSENVEVNDALLKTERECEKLSRELNTVQQQLSKSETSLRSARDERDCLERAAAHLRGEMLDPLSTGHLKALRKDLKLSLGKVESEISTKEEEERKCSVCLTAEKTHVLVPCGHRFCVACAHKLHVCALCRNRPKQIMELF